MQKTYSMLSATLGKAVSRTVPTFMELNILTVGEMGAQLIRNECEPLINSDEMALYLCSISSKNP